MLGQLMRIAFVGNNLALDVLLALARNQVMTPEEREAQRQSWVRGEMALGTDADEALDREALENVNLAVVAPRIVG